MNYLKSIKLGIGWIQDQMLTFDNGYYGIYERIRLDCHTRTNWSRPDCNAEYLRVLYNFRCLTGSDEYLPMEEKLINWLERTQDTETLSVWRGSMPFYLIDGTIREGKADQSIYQNDNGKILNVMCQLYQASGDERLLGMALGLAGYWLKTQQPDGTYGVIDGKNVQECRKGPCFVQWLAAGFYRLYAITRDDKYLQSAEKAMSYLLPMVLDSGRCLTTYEIIKMEDWRPVSSETVMMLETLAIAYKVTEKKAYLEKLNSVGAYMLSLQHKEGAIMNCHGDTPEASLQNNKDLCDLVYTQGFAIQALLDAYDVTQNVIYSKSAALLGDFLAGIQCSGESPLWDGGWRGSYNMVTRRWDGQANQNNLIDEGGMYSVYTGWCCTNILYGLELLEKHNSLKEAII